MFSLHSTESLMNIETHNRCVQDISHSSVLGDSLAG